MKTNPGGVVAQTLALALVVGVASWALSETTGSDTIKARQEAMESINDAMQGLAAIAKKEAPFDAGVVTKNAGTIAEHFKKVANLFPAGSETGDVETWAKSEIWSDRDGFEYTLDSAQKAAVALQSVSDEADFSPALGKLGENCKACHEMYRRPKH